MIVDVYLHHRFTYLARVLPLDWNVNYHWRRVDKTMLWNAKNVQVWWEYQDGIRPDQGQEDVTKLMQCWNARDTNKAFVYVKPNLSNVQCMQHRTFARSCGFPILTCPRWSYYDAYDSIVNHRHALREKRTKSSIDDKIVFYGSSLSFGRENVIQEATQKWGDRFNISSGLDREAYITDLLKQAWSFQPHGIGLRHAIYESMALGVPSLIPDSTYLDDITRSCNNVYTTLPDVPNYKSSEYEHLSARCVEVWEEHMTARAINDCVLKQLKTLGFW